MTDSAKILFIRFSVVFCAVGFFVSGFLSGASCEVRKQTQEAQRERDHKQWLELPTIREASPETVRAFREAEFKRSVDGATVSMKQLTQAVDGFLATVQSVMDNEYAWRQLALMRSLLTSKDHQPCLKQDLRDCYKEKKP